MQVAGKLMVELTIKAIRIGIGLARTSREEVFFINKITSENDPPSSAKEWPLVRAVGSTSS